MTTYHGPDAWIELNGQVMAIEYKLHSPGDRATDPSSRYGTCLREQMECTECEDTGVLSEDKMTSRDYCDCYSGRYIARVEREDD